MTKLGTNVEEDTNVLTGLISLKKERLRVIIPSWGEGKGDTKKIN